MLHLYIPCFILPPSEHAIVQNTMLHYTSSIIPKQAQSYFLQNTQSFIFTYHASSGTIFTKGSAVHWPLPDGFEGSKNRQSGEIQKSIGVSRQGGTHFSIAAYSMQQSAFPVQLHNDTKQAVPITMSPFFRAQFAGTPAKQHGVSVASHAITTGPFLSGTTEPWYSSKASCAPAQLTIFYGGMVNVYDDISPEKAQAIMFLAGNGASASTQVPVPRTPAGDAVYVSQPMNTQPCSALSSPISVSSHPVNKDEAAAKTVGSSVKVDTPRVINSLEQVMQSAVPQARKASLARFLEKRKERVMGSAPYGMSKSSCEYPGRGASSANAVAASEA